MAVVFEMRNTRTIHPLCQFALNRFSVVGPGYFAPLFGTPTPWEVPCSVCLLPGGYCNNVSVNRVFHPSLEYPYGFWSYSFADADAGAEETWELLIADDPYDPIVLEFSDECHWTDEDLETGPGYPVASDFILEWDLRASPASLNPTLTDFLLRVTGRHSTDSPQTSWAVNYTAQNVDPVSLDAIVFTTVGNRMWNLNPPFEESWIEFPAQWILTPEDIAP